MYYIEKKFTFEAAHSLVGLCDGHPCEKFHGHGFRLYIKISAEDTNNVGMIVDFNDLRQFKNEVIDKFFDHKTIYTHDAYSPFPQTDIYRLPKEFNNTTAENLCKHIHDLLIEFFRKIKFDNYTRVEVRIYETENNCAGYYKKYTPGFVMD